MKTSLVRDRARVQIGRISMFGLMELSRQRLRSSLIDKSFEKCNFCKGSGLILNSNSISDQIIKVIKEKMASNANSTIGVRCNTILAENLLNIKKNEIVQLENNFNSKINFYFNNQYSLHDPIIEVEGVNDTVKKDDNINSDSKKIKKQKILKKNISPKKRVTKKSIVKKNKIKINKISNKEKEITKEIDIETTDIGDEKTGWWS